MSSDPQPFNLDEVFDFRSGLSKPRSAFGKGYPFLTFKDVFYNKFVPKELGDLVESSAAERASGDIKRGDVFLTRTSETQHELGMSCVALSDVPNGTFNGFTKRLRPKPGTKIVPEYAAYYFRSPEFRERVTAISTLSTRASLNEAMLAHLQIALPDVATQISIGKILKSLDDKIELLREMNQTLENIARVVFRTWFVDFEPVCAKAAGAASFRGMPQHLFDKLPDAFDDANVKGIPRGWSNKKVEELFDVSIGRTPPRKQKEHFVEGGKGVPWLSIKTMGDIQVFARMTEEDLAPQAVTQFRVPIVPPGIVLVSFKLTVGRVAITSVEMATNEAIAHLFPRRKGLPGVPYTYCYMREYDYNELGSTSSIATAVNSQSIRSIPFLWPGGELVEAFNERTQSVFDQIETNTLEIATLAAVRDALLPKLISGELETPSLEALGLKAVDDGG
jgi:type I restriction enzyme S subunit